MTPAEIDALDPGIRLTVRWLRDHCFTTTDSGDGVTKIAAGLTADDGVLDLPHVFATVDPRAMVAEANRLWDLVCGRGLGDTGRVEATYSPEDGFAILAALYGVNDDILVTGA